MAWNQEEALKYIWISECLDLQLRNTFFFFRPFHKFGLYLVIVHRRLLWRHSLISLYKTIKWSSFGRISCLAFDCVMMHKNKFLLRMWSWVQDELLLIPITDLIHKLIQHDSLSVYCQHMTPFKDDFWLSYIINVNAIVTEYSVGPKSRL